MEDSKRVSVAKGEWRGVCNRKAVWDLLKRSGRWCLRHCLDGLRLRKVTLTQSCDFIGIEIRARQLTTTRFILRKLSQQISNFIIDTSTSHHFRVPALHKVRESN
ncbi:hypothetical protein TNCV_1440251 [Trichonephila clavipes]|nr:hypothetical protein TNCV_1440251 [Trichonephila clavipes]